ncbi:trigger factor [Candidatus Kaiserbacteria bacterium]|nr:trigger factor [Candidatus Kaiserbacteria bacterium]
MTHDELQAFSIEKGDHSTVTITGEIPFTYLAKQREAALKAIGKDMEVDGFRKGHVPEKVILEKVGEMTLLQEMAERAINEAYPEIVSEHKLEVVGYPQISITKIAQDNPLGFKAIVAVLPKITLPDYKKIAADINKKRESHEVTDEEVEKQIEDIMRQKMAYERLQSKAVAKKEGASGEVDEHVHDENCAHDHETPITEEEDFSKLPLPELTDEYVKALGQPGQFTSVQEFKSKLREHLAVEKERDVASRHRAQITDAIVEKTTVDLPEVMTNAEIQQMLAQMREDLNRAQLKFEDYLTHIKKTEEELIAEWTPSAEKRAKLQLVLNEIGKKEEINPDPSAVDHQVSHLLEQYKDADETRVRVYVESVLTNEVILKMLEEQK